MNIKEAKLEIQNTLLAYHRKDAAGHYLYPTVRQRPILLMGPPGIGKTAILEQVAQECGVGLVAYTMTHHTRQSAIGLPHIQTRTYDGRETAVTEYTMSEIIASVYDCMARTGKQEGILFLDEVNCVSETLAPTMLQLLQNKTFGSHRIPEGWLIVAAGNPPAYNKSVREFDMATLDRVRLIPVEADCAIWMEYARERQLHGAILSWLSIKPQQFYVAEDTADGPVFVTARGWEDLSELLKGYEALGISVSRHVVRQFLQKPEAADAFAAYYQLYRKYQTDYGVTALLENQLPPAVYAEKVAMAQSGGFEERFTVIRLLLDALDSQLAQFRQARLVTAQLHEALLQFRQQTKPLAEFTASRRHALQVKLQAELLTPEQRQTEEQVLDRLNTWDSAAKQAHKWSGSDVSGFLSAQFGQETDGLQARSAAIKEQLDAAFAFAEACFGQGQELVLLVSELAHSSRAMEFIAAYGCDAFLRHSEILLYRRREQELQQQCRELME